MRLGRFHFAVIMVLVACALAGCSHRVVADKGKDTATVYMDEDIYNSVVGLQGVMKDPKSKPDLQSFSAGLVGYALTHEAKEVGDGTRVKILSKSAKGCTVELLEGPNIGYKGFIPKDNLR